VSTRDERLVENQHAFRSANERLQSAIDGQISGAVTVPFLCECADLRCRGRVEMTTNDYETVHILRNQYVILPGHAMSKGEIIVAEDSDGYLVVQKG
jgi:hypothetical protein